MWRCGHQHNFRGSTALWLPRPAGPATGGGGSAGRRRKQSGLSALISVQQEACERGDDESSRRGWQRGKCPPIADTKLHAGFRPHAAGSPARPTRQSLPVISIPFLWLLPCKSHTSTADHPYIAIAPPPQWRAPTPHIRCSTHSDAPWRPRQRQMRPLRAAWHGEPVTPLLPMARSIALCTDVHVAGCRTRGGAVALCRACCAASCRRGGDPQRPSPWPRRLPRRADSAPPCCAVLCCAAGLTMCRCLRATVPRPGATVPCCPALLCSALRCTPQPPPHTPHPTNLTHPTIPHTPNTIPAVPQQASGGPVAVGPGH